jgi:hypothetical protein
MGAPKTEVKPTGSFFCGILWMGICPLFNHLAFAKDGSLRIESNVLRGSHAGLQAARVPSSLWISRQFTGGTGATHWTTQECLAAHLGSRRCLPSAIVNRRDLYGTS